LSYLTERKGVQSMIYEKIISRRTIRKFIQKEVPTEILVKCVDAARLSPSASNLQPLKYIIINDKELLKEVFSTLRWAGHIPDYKHAENEKPVAYIVMLLDRSIRRDPYHDAGIAAMSIALVADDEGLGSCMLGAVDRIKLGKILNLLDNLEILLVIALGYPAEKPVVEKMKNDDVRYWLDENKLLHVPKRDLETIVKWNQ